MSLFCVVLQYVHKLCPIIMREGLEGRVWRALELFIHSVAKTLLPPGKLLAPHYCSTWPRVSGSLRARKLPAASAPEAKRMGTALVIPTNEVKMLMPKTAANLQRALRKPNAVVLRKERGQIKRTSGVIQQQKIHPSLCIPNTTIFFLTWTVKVSLKT